LSLTGFRTADPLLVSVLVYCGYRCVTEPGTSVGIVTDYGLDGRMIGVRFLAGAGNFSLRHRVQTGSGAHPASYSVSTRGFTLG
jgi:hypothetical protein